MAWTGVVAGFISCKGECSRVLTLEIIVLTPSPFSFIICFGSFREGGCPVEWEKHMDFGISQTSNQFSLVCDLGQIT